MREEGREEDREARRERGTEGKVIDREEARNGESEGRRERRQIGRESGKGRTVFGGGVDDGGGVRGEGGREVCHQRRVLQRKGGRTEGGRGR